MIAVIFINFHSIIVIEKCIVFYFLLFLLLHFFFFGHILKYPGYDQMLHVHSIKMEKNQLEIFKNEKEKLERRVENKTYTHTHTHSHKREWLKKNIKRNHEF